ncbi:MAG: ATP-binding cassette domain-containing protein [Muribaculaceae bacterium]|nr:ATP-binding cassette domain-containing protein [Muribaculaceae bacterium]
MDKILEIENVSKHYAGHTALDNVSLDIPRGQVYGLLGPNGAGKTTLIRIINHITAPDSGSVMFNGHRLSQNDVANIGYLPEERGLYKKMKVGEQALFFARLKGLSNRDAQIKLRQWFDRFEITSWWNKKVEELSKGMAQKVQFIITVLHEPELLIFDEPFSGFDPINANLLKNEILALRDKGATVIFSTHNMSSVEAVCDNITLINKSRNILTGNVAEIRQQMGANRYRIAVTNPPQQLLQGVDAMIEEHRIEKTDGDTTTLILRVNPGVTRRELLRAANEAADVTLFSPALPSMDEVFISTVEKFNSEHK